MVSWPFIYCSLISQPRQPQSASHLVDESPSELAYRLWREAETDYTERDEKTEDSECSEDDYSGIDGDSGVRYQALNYSRDANSCSVTVWNIEIYVIQSVAHSVPAQEQAACSCCFRVGTSSGQLRHCYRLAEQRSNV